MSVHYELGLKDLTVKLNDNNASEIIRMLASGKKDALINFISENYSHGEYFKFNFGYYSVDKHKFQICIEENYATINLLSCGKYSDDAMEPFIKDLLDIAVEGYIYYDLGDSASDYVFVGDVKDIKKRYPQGFKDLNDNEFIYHFEEFEEYEHCNSPVLNYLNNFFDTDNISDESYVYTSYEEYYKSLPVNTKGLIIPKTHAFSERVTLTHPELKYPVTIVDYNKDNKPVYSYETIYGRIRVYTFQLQIAGLISSNVGTDLCYLDKETGVLEDKWIDKLLRSANSEAVRNTISAFRSQYNSLKNLDFISQKELNSLSDKANEDCGNK